VGSLLLLSSMLSCSEAGVPWWSECCHGEADALQLLTVAASGVLRKVKGREMYTLGEATVAGWRR
jgi:hypothetical protein